jgi:site-specific DNA-methyltransferase (adenine-specific)
MDNIVLLSRMDVLDSLALVKDRLGAVAAVVLDPWYNRGTGGVREDYREWLAGVLAASAAVADHVFLWGFPDTLGGLLGTVPGTHELLAWLTWHYKNCPSVVRGWRPSQQACLHIARRGAKTHPENFLNDDQRQRLRDGKMRFMPGPPTVLEAPLIVGFVGRKERTGHPAQKPLAVIEPLVMMSTAPGDVVVDPMCGSGTTGEACRQLGRRAVLSDASEEYTGMAAAAARHEGGPPPARMAGCRPRCIVGRDTAD